MRFRSVLVQTFLILGVSLSLSLQAATPGVIVTLTNATDMDRYCLKMLELAVAHMDTPYKIQPDSGGQRTQSRYVEDIISGKIDLMWTATDQSLENQMQPVRIPLLKGLLGT